MIGSQAALWCNRAVEQALEDLARDVNDAFIFADTDSKLDSLAVLVPAGVLGEAKNMVGSLGDGSG